MSKKSKSKSYIRKRINLMRDSLEKEISYIEDASNYISILKGNGCNLPLTRGIFAKARVTFETMQLNTLDDYFLFFASANLLNICAKRMHTGYNFKKRMEYAIKAISQEHALKQKCYNPIKDCTSFYSEKEGNFDCFFVTISGVQFSFHRAVDEHINTYPGAKKQKWAGIRLQFFATDTWEYANRLDNLSEMSLVRDDDYNPISLKELQYTALLNCTNEDSPYFETYKDCEDIFYVPICEEDENIYFENLFSKLSSDNRLKCLLESPNFIELCENKDVKKVHETMRELYFDKNKHQNIITEKNMFENTEYRDRWFFENGNLCTASSLEEEKRVRKLEEQRAQKSEENQKPGDLASNLGM